MGTWSAESNKNDIDYPNITIDEKFLILTSKADTLYGYKYKSNSTSLFLDSLPKKYMKCIYIKAQGKE
ncbi:hypothetical protein [uncultured Algibacter sp.]|uniref:hypothetical protein n=1 Tax=uncultured Algibacter sp. TaxID=298659 RepID=UPI0032165693